MLLNSPALQRLLTHYNAGGISYLVVQVAYILIYEYMYNNYFVYSSHITRNKLIVLRDMPFYLFIITKIYTCSVTREIIVLITRKYIDIL